MKTLTVRFTTRGTAAAIYDDALLDAIDALGTSMTRRASTVEPDAHGDWVADLAPVSGPRLTPCRRRADALAAEVEWLREHLTSCV